MVDGHLNFDTKIDTKGFSKGVDNLQDSLKSVKSALGKLAAAAAAAFSLKAAISFGKQAVESAAAVKAANSQMEQTFGSLQVNANAAMKRIADSSGIVQTRLNSVGTSIYAFAKTTGMDSVKALGMMEEALRVTADSAAYYDRSLEDTAESLKSFLKGNYANDAALGISCTETTRNTAANKLYGKSFMELSEAQKQLTLLQMVKDANKLSGAEGQAAREADGWENVIGNLKETWKQFLAVVGQPILAVATTAIKRISAALSELTAIASRTIGTLSELFGIENDSTIDVASNIEESVIQQNALTDSVEETATAQEKSIAGFDKINKIGSDTSGTPAVPETASVGGTPVLSQTMKVNADTSQASGAIESLRKKLSAMYLCAKEVVKARFEAGGVSESLDIIRENIDSIRESFKYIFSDSSVQENAKNALRSIATYFVSAVADFNSIGINLAAAVTSGMADWLDSKKEWISGRLSSMFENVSITYDFSTQILNDVTDIINALLRLPETAKIISNVANIVFTPIITAADIAGRFFRDVFGGIARIISDNKDGFIEVGTSILSFVADVTSGISAFIDNACESISEVYDTYLSPAIDGIMSGINTFVGWVVGAYNTYIAPLVDKIGKDIKEFFEGKLSKTFGKFMEMLGKVAKLISDVFQNVIVPVVTKIGNVVMPFIKTIGEAIWGLIKGAASIITDTLGVIFDVIGNFIDIITSLFTGDFAGVIDGFKNLFSDVWEFLKSLFDDLIGIFESIGEFLLGLLQNIGDFFIGIWDGIVEVFSGVADWFSEKFQAAWDLIVAIWTVVTDFFSGIWDGIKAVFEAVADWFKEKFEAAWNNVKAIWDLVTGFFSDIWDGIKGVFSEIGGWFKEKFEEAWNNITAVFEVVGGWFSDRWDDIKAVFSKVGGWFKEKFEEALDNIKGVFTDIGEFFGGIWEDIKGIFSSVGSKIGDAFSGAFKGVVNSIFEWVESKLNFFIDLINGAISFINEIPGVELGYLDYFELPRLAKGGLATAPVLAMVGDNPNAKTDPEVIAPLSKLKEIFLGTSPEMSELIRSICDILKKGIHIILDGVTRIEIPDFKPLSWLTEIKVPQIPSLALGTVIPASCSELLSDTRTGTTKTEIADAVKQAVLELRATGTDREMPKQITLYTYLYPNSKAFQKEVIDVVSNDKARRGG